VQWAITGLPTGVTASISANPDAAKPTITLIASAAAIIGTYPCTVQGTFGSFVNSTPLSVSVVA
jgi:hypothetical protein